MYVVHHLRVFALNSPQSVLTCQELCSPPWHGCRWGQLDWGCVRHVADARNCCQGAGRQVPDQRSRVLSEGGRSRSLPCVNPGLGASFRKTLSLQQAKEAGYLWYILIYSVPIPRYTPHLVQFDNQSFARRCPNMSAGQGPNRPNSWTFA